MDPRAPDETDERILEALAAVGMLGVGLSGWLGGLLWLARSGLETPPLLLPACLSIFAAAACAPCALPHGWRSRLGSVPWSLPLLSLAVLLSPILVFASGRGPGLVYPLLAALGLWRAATLLARRSRASLVPILLIPPVLAIHLFLEINAERFAHVYTPEYAQLGLLSQDTLFHTAMAHMIQNFGQGSIGIDGLVPFKYHHGSHLWLAALARLAGTTPLYSYPFGQIVIAVPSLFLGLFAAIALLSAGRKGLAARLALATVLVLVFDRVGWNSYYISESYTVGLAALLLGTPLLLDFARQPRRSPRYENIRTAAMLLVIVVAACLKVSVGTVLGATFGWLVLRAHGISGRTLSVGLGLLGVAALVWLRLKPETGLALGDSFEILHFYRDPNRNLDRARGLTAPLLPLLTLLWLAWRHRGSPDASERAAARRTAELLAFSLSVALLPGSLLVMWPATAWWFANVPHWLALPIVTGGARFDALPASRRRATAIALATLLLVWTAVSLTDTRFARAVLLAGDLYTRALDLAGEPLTHPSDAGPTLWHAWRENGRLFDAAARRGLARSRGARLLAEIERLRPDDAPDFAVFAPPSNQQMWSWGRPRCVTAALQVPALAGVPLVKGHPPRCPVEGAMRPYGYHDYGEESRTADVSPEGLCRHALDRGIERIVVLESLEEPQRNRLLDCSPRPEDPAPSS